MLYLLPFFCDLVLNHVPTLTEAKLQGLDRLTRNYTYLSQEEPPLEEIVKLVVVSPLLDLAGFYQFPRFAQGLKQIGSYISDLRS
jgi:hypothetical protein